PGYETVKANIIILYKGEELFQSPYLYKGSLDQALAELSLNGLPPTTTSSSSSLVAAMPKVDDLKWLFDTNAPSNSLRIFAIYILISYICRAEVKLRQANFAEVTANDIIDCNS
ncbi:unnamed protein product, partial [Adineta steineri]